MYTAASAAVCVVCATQPGAAHQPDEVVVPEVAGDHERRRRVREGRGAVDVGAPFEQHASSSELVVEASEAQWRGVLMVEPVEPGARGEQQLHDPHVSASVQRRPAHPKEALRREPGGRAAAWWAFQLGISPPIGHHAFDIGVGVQQLAQRGVVLSPARNELAGRGQGTQSRGALGSQAVWSGSLHPVARGPRRTEATFRTGSATQWPSQRAARGRRACTEAMRTPPAHHIREVQR